MIARVIVLRKPGKPLQRADSYRPISLLPTLSKVAEKIIYRRLTDVAREKTILPPHQFGFRREHGTVHQIMGFTEEIIDNFNISTATGALCLDIAKAFDRVWHSSLIYKLHKFDIPYWLIRLIRYYLENRRFEVRLNQNISTQRTIRAGVPQGSILGPLLFNIYISDIPQLKKCILAQYADDTITYTHHRNPDIIASNLHKDMDTLLTWLTKWKIKLNAEKTEAIIFNKKKKRAPQRVEINNTEIPWTQEVKYLDVRMDRKLTFKVHIPNTKKKSAT